MVSACRGTAGNQQECQMPSGTSSQLKSSSTVNLLDVAHFEVAFDTSAGTLPHGHCNVMDSLRSLSASCTRDVCTHRLPGPSLALRQTLDYVLAALRMRRPDEAEKLLLFQRCLPALMECRVCLSTAQTRLSYGEKQALAALSKGDADLDFGFYCIAANSSLCWVCPAMPCRKEVRQRGGLIAMKICL